MAGTKEGAAKAAQTNKEKYGEDFYRIIGGQSWKNPDRSRETGFALLPKEEVVRLGREGGKKNKGKKYAKKEVEYTTAEEIRALLSEEDNPTVGPDVSE